MAQKIQKMAQNLKENTNKDILTLRKTKLKMHWETSLYPLVCYYTQSYQRSTALMANRT